ncbi:MAG TPA: CheR family methyltransferase [Chloroflexota bacterium]|nr:CheR family methyltransferase [Chloroflexota bacterium]
MGSSSGIKNSKMGMTRAEYLLFQELIGQNSGLRLEDRDWTPLRGAVFERVAAVGCSTLGEYYEMMRDPAGSLELGRLIELLTVHETAFFRNRLHFDLLIRHILPELMEKGDRSRPIRVWSAGCSTGQEAYSIAIALLESPLLSESVEFEVLATDISNRALDIARAGTYPPRALRNLDPQLLDRYFSPCDGGYEVNDRVRSRVRFEYLNLVKEPFPLAALSPFDVVFCENVTIYFKVESTRRVIKNFHDVLGDGGYLFLGYSETLWQIPNEFLLRELDGTFVYQKSLGAEVSPPASIGTVAAGSALTTSAAPKPGAKPAARPVRSVPPAVARPPRRRYSIEEATALYEGRCFEEALLAVESVLSTSPNDRRAHLLAAKLRADREEVGPALRHCRRALDSDPLLEEGHYLMGVLQMRAGEYDSAVESLSRVIYLNSSGHRSALAHFHLAGLHADVERWELAAREYRNALRLLERFPKEELVGEFSADFLAGVCRRRLQELGQ